jgi:hypothetical protein
MILEMETMQARQETAVASLFRNDRSIAYWIVLIGVPMLLAIAAARLIPLGEPEPIYTQYAHEYAQSGRIADTTYPLEYAWMLGLSIKALGIRGPEIFQGALYLMTVISVWALAKKCGASAGYALIAGLAAAAYPQLPESVTKIWDVELAVFLMVLFMLCTVCLMRDGPRPLLIIATGIALGFCLAQRPNMLLLIPMPVYFLFSSGATWRRKVAALVVASGLSVLIVVTVNTLAHGSFFLSQNGPYNLVQGHNEYSIPVMLRDLSSEPTVPLIMQADGLDPATMNAADPEQRRYFTRRTIAYLRSHPLEEVKITAVKMWTIFRPNTRKHRTLDAQMAVIVCMSLIFPAWLIFLFRQWRGPGWTRVDWTFIAAFGLYVLPFLITASDPRYQIPIEICMLSHIAYMISPPSKKATLAT